MAITPAACQAELGANAQNAQIVRADEVVGTTLQGWYVLGMVDAPGRARYVTTTRSDNAATQAAEILTKLRA